MLRKGMSHNINFMSCFHRQGREGVINVLDGLLLYKDIINQRWETELIEWIEECVRLGLCGQLAGTYI